MVMLSTAALFATAAAAAAAAGSVTHQTSGLRESLGRHDILLQAANAADAAGVVPENSLTHFCVITGWDNHNETLHTYAALLGQDVPTAGIAGGVAANGTYLGRCVLKAHARTHARLHARGELLLVLLNRARPCRASSSSCHGDKCT